jgi:hypothetical protein
MFWGCGYMFPPKKMILNESTTQVSSAPPGSSTIPGSLPRVHEIPELGFAGWPAS